MNPNAGTNDPGRLVDLKKNGRILVVDDNESIHKDFRKILTDNSDDARFDADEAALFGVTATQSTRIPYEISYASQGGQALDIVRAEFELGHRFAVAFIDVRMPPGWDGLETTVKLWEIDPDLQVILCTAYSDRSWEEMVEKIRFPERLLVLKKPFDAIEVLQLACSLTEKWSLLQSSKRNLEELEKAVQNRTRELAESEERFFSAFHFASIGMSLISLNGRFHKVNRALSSMLGYTESELLTCTFRDVSHPEDIDLELDLEQRLLQGGISDYQVEKRCLHKNKKVVLVRLSVSLVHDHNNQAVHFIAQFQDITESSRLEQELFQARKLETVGRLSAGVAHEFNSLLTAILGQSELLLLELPASSPIAKHAAEIRDAGERAAQLTRQLLAYGRKQMLQPAALDLHQVIEEMVGVFRGLLRVPVDVELELVAGADLRLVNADSARIAEVVLNLMINAREAMPKGGKIKLVTANVSFANSTETPSPDLAPGNYVMLSVTDSGEGVSEEIRQHLFEPFYSTKGAGRGLGLSTAYGIAKQSGGHISFENESPKGAKFLVYLPEHKVTPKQHEPAGNRGGNETILLVEDEPALRRMASMFLQRIGYKVFVAEDGLNALKLMQELGAEPIDLLLTDVLLPKMNGIELASEFLAVHPLTPVLFTSGNTNEEMLRECNYDPGTNFLEKPFVPSALARKVREVLDGASQP